MSQVSLGFASVTNGSASVTSDTSANWSGVVAGNMFTLAGSGVFYQIAAVPTYSGGIWHLTLVSNYGGVTAANINYVIHGSFTPVLGLPYPEQGDTQTAAIVKRNALNLDAYLAPGVYALTDAATIAVDATKLPVNKVASVTLAGNRTMVISNAVDGQLLRFRVTQDATGARTLTVTNGRATVSVPALTLASAANKITYFDLMYVAGATAFDYVNLKT